MTAVLTNEDLRLGQTIQSEVTFELREVLTEEARVHFAYNPRLSTGYFEVCAELSCEIRGHPMISLAVVRYHDQRLVAGRHITFVTDAVVRVPSMLRSLGLIPGRLYRRHRGLTNLDVSYTRED